MENIKLNGLPRSVKFTDSRPPKRKNEESWIPIEDYLNMHEYHHYCANSVATQFCSFIQKKNSSEWMAHHDDVHFEAFLKLSDITSYFLTKTEDEWRSDSLKSVNLHFFYPVVVLQGIMLDVKVNKKRGIKSKKTQHIQFLRTTIQNNEATAYQIDVVTEYYFPKYLNIIENEMLITMDRMKENLDTINNVAREIANKPLIPVI